VMASIKETSRTITWKTASTLRWLALELTNVCNMKCSRCWSQSPVLNGARPKGFMTRELFYSILIELTSNYPLKEMIVGLNYGGESMLHPNFEEYSDACADKHFRELQLATNGTMLSGRMNKVLLRDFTQIAVSLHNVKELQWVIARTKSLFEGREKGAVRPNIRANIVAEEFNQQQLDDVTEAIHGHVDGVRIVGAISEDLQLPGNDKGPVNPLWPGCQSLYFYLGVLWNGDALPCCHILSPGAWSLGNVDQESLKEVFHGKTYENLRNRHFEGSPCMTCQVRR